MRINSVIGASGGKDKTVGFVLGRFSKEDESEVKEGIENASKMALALIEGEKIEKIMQLYIKNDTKMVAKCEKNIVKKSNCAKLYSEEKFSKIYF